LISVIDFGSSAFHERNYPYRPRGSGIFEAPEQKTQRFGRRSDVWSAAILVAEMLLGQPFIIKTQTPRKIVPQFKLDFLHRDQQREQQSKEEEAKNPKKEIERGSTPPPLPFTSPFWDRFRGADCSLPYNMTPEAEDLLYHMTRYDPKERIRASTALLHRYFQDT